MKNLLDENAATELNGRILFSTSFINEMDLKDRKVLDVGCGFGWFELFALDAGVKEISGIERSEDDLVTARRSIKNSRAIFKVGSAIELPFPDESFDAVVSWEVLEHIPYGTENKMFSEIYRVLMPGGTFYMSTPNDSLNRLFWILLSG